MNKYILSAVLLLFAAGTYSCKKHKNPPKVPPPQWKVDTSGKYPASMTAVVRIPDYLMQHGQPGDQLGAFINGECRGIGKLIKLDAGDVYFVLIIGEAAEQDKVSFSYYSAYSSYMYGTSPFLDFTMDGNYGTADHPEKLALTPGK
ncbi:hypothetical protein [Compostibacter hankyongensis]|uniref:Uncharacterized protein n=1 Tax=Compostibacter hankyongensis TaxID=1007089 RepID=A0ABP8FKN7_9BACT